MPVNQAGAHLKLLGSFLGRSHPLVPGCPLPSSFSGHMLIPQHTASHQTHISRILQTSVTVTVSVGGGAEGGGGRLKRKMDVRQRRLLHTDRDWVLQCSERGRETCPEPDLILHRMQGLDRVLIAAIHQRCDAIQNSKATP